MLLLKIRQWRRSQWRLSKIQAQQTGLQSPFLFLKEWEVFACRIPRWTERSLHSSIFTIWFVVFSCSSWIRPVMTDILICLHCLIILMIVNNLPEAWFGFLWFRFHFYLLCFSTLWLRFNCVPEFCYTDEISFHFSFHFVQTAFASAIRMNSRMKLQLLTRK